MKKKMNINRAKLMRDYVLRRKHFEESSFKILSPSDIAFQIGIKPGTLYQFLVGNVKLNPEELAKFCRWLGKKVDDYLD